VLAISLVPQIRPYLRYLALGIVVLTLALVASFRWSQPATAIPVLWQPSSLLGVSPILRNDTLTQPLALTLTLLICSTILVSLGRSSALGTTQLGSLLGLLAAVLFTLWAGTPLTLLLGWASFDVIQAVGRLAADDQPQQVVRSLIFGSLANLLLYVGALLLGDGRTSAVWSLMTPMQAQVGLWMAAALLRIWVYPFHFAKPVNLNRASAAPLLLSPVLGWGLWLRLAEVNGGPLPGGSWLLTLGTISIAASGFLAWSASDSQRAPAWISVAVNSLILVGAGLAGANAVSIILAGSIGWAAGLTALSLHAGLRTDAIWWSIGGIVGAMALAGLPLTPGLPVQTVLLGGIARSGRPAWGLALFIGYLFLIPALVRCVLARPSTTAPTSLREIILQGLGLALPVLLLLVGGLLPRAVIHRSVPSLSGMVAVPLFAGWLLWALALVGGGVLAWQDRAIRARIELTLQALYDLLCLEWLYDGVVGALGRGLSVLRAADEVIGGAGAVLWSLLLFLLLLLLWESR